MKARPILFSSPMIRALLAGSKTQTRRIVKPQPGELDRPFMMDDGTWHVTDSRGGNMSPLGTHDNGACPYGGPGDLLWVREGGELLRDAYDNDPATGQDLWRDVGWVHGADGQIIERPRFPSLGGLAEWVDACARHRRPSIHMPRWASRLTLEITGVRVERLQDISEADAKAEGLFEWALQGPSDDTLLAWGWKPREADVGFATPVGAYRGLWKHINGPGSWDANPYVWAVSFSVIRKNIDEVLRDCAN